MSNNTDNNMQEIKPDIFDKIMHLPGLRVFEPLYKKYKEVLLYLFFGVLTTVVSIGSYAFFNVELMSLLQMLFHGYLQYFLHSLLTGYGCLQHQLRLWKNL